MSWFTIFLIGTTLVSYIFNVAQAAPVQLHNLIKSSSTSDISQIFTLDVTSLRDLKPGRIRYKKQTDKLPFSLPQIINPRSENAASNSASLPDQSVITYWKKITAVDKFLLHFHCVVPNIDLSKIVPYPPETTTFAKPKTSPTITATPRFSTSTTTTAPTNCLSAHETFVRGLNRISKIMNIQSVIKVNATFHSFCISDGGYWMTVNNNGAEGIQCSTRENQALLGTAAPGNWRAWNESEANRYNVDGKYLYPSTLAKQIAPDQYSLVLNTEELDAINLLNSNNSINVTTAQLNDELETSFDVVSRFNSDFGWWYPSDADSKGDGFGLPFTEFVDSSKKLQPAWGIKVNGRIGYDFEQVVLHEFMHGFGIISSWYPWLGLDQYPDLLLPAWPEMDDRGVITGWGKPFLFNKWMTTRIANELYAIISGNSSEGSTSTSTSPTTSVWVEIVSDFILQMSNEIVGVDSESWYANFSRTNAYNFSKELMRRATLAEGGIGMWIPAESFEDDTMLTPTKRSVKVDDKEKVYQFAALYTPQNFSEGATLSHLETSLYEGTPDFLMRPVSTAGIGLDGYEPQDRKGPMGKIIYGVLKAMGYPMR